MWCSLVFIHLWVINVIFFKRLFSVFSLWVCWLMKDIESEKKESVFWWWIITHTKKWSLQEEKSFKIKKMIQMWTACEVENFKCEVKNEKKSTRHLIKALLSNFLSEYLLSKWFFSACFIYISVPAVFLLLHVIEIRICAK